MTYFLKEDWGPRLGKILHRQDGPDNEAPSPLPKAVAAMQRRIGRFLLPNTLIRDMPDAALRCLSGCLVVRAEQRWDVDGIDYTALNEAFAEVEPGTIPPEYEPVSQDDGTILWRPKLDYLTRR